MSRTESPDEIVQRLLDERSIEPQARISDVHLAITGGRDHIPGQREIDAFLAHWKKIGGTHLHHGDARGVDRYMAAVVRRNLPKVKIIAHRANWDLYGKRAGLIRNSEMVGQVQGLIAFHGGRGTEHCVKAAKSSHLPVYFVPTIEPLTAEHKTDSFTEAPHSQDGPAGDGSYRPGSPPLRTDLCPHKFDWSFVPRLARWNGQCQECGWTKPASPEEEMWLEIEVARHCDENPPKA